jgi:hypothetical protein
MLFATDGISLDFTRDVDALEPPQAITQRVLSHYNKGTDDALAMAARYLGDGR